MSTITVWIMVMFTYNGGIVTGPEFRTQERCEKASLTIKEAILKERHISGLYQPQCVKIQK